MKISIAEIGIIPVRQTVTADRSKSVTNAEKRYLPFTGLPANRLSVLPLAEARCVDGRSTSQITNVSPTEGSKKS